MDIDCVPFSSWRGDHDPEEGVFNFVGIMQMIKSPEFAEAGYKWIAIDSLTEMSDRLMEHLEAENKDGNNFKLYGDNARIMIGALKWIGTCRCTSMLHVSRKEKDARCDPLLAHGQRCSSQTSSCPL